MLLQLACLDACLHVGTGHDTAHAVSVPDAGVQHQPPPPPRASLFCHHAGRDSMALYTDHSFDFTTFSFSSSGSSSSLRGVMGHAAPMQVPSEAAAPLGGPAFNCVLPPG